MSCRAIAPYWQSARAGLDHCGRGSILSRRASIRWGASKVAPKPGVRRATGLPLVTPASSRSRASRNPGGPMLALLSCAGDSGISGIVGGLLARRSRDVGWRAVFVVGLILGGLVYGLVTGGAIPVSM